MKRKIVTISVLFILTLFLSIPVMAETVTQGTSVQSLKPSVTSSANKENLNAESTDILSTTKSSQDKQQTSLVNENGKEGTNTPTKAGTSTTMTVAESSSDLPKAGLSPIITVAMGGIVLLAALLYKKVVKYNI